LRSHPTNMDTSHQALLSSSSLLLFAAAINTSVLSVLSVLSVWSVLSVLPVLSVWRRLVVRVDGTERIMVVVAMMMMMMILTYFLMTLTFKTTNSSKNIEP